jgi:hypothetical protein
MIDVRHLLALAILLAVTAVPTVVHSYLPVNATDGRATARIASRLNGLDARPTDRSLVWLPDAMAVVDYTERRYGPDLRLLAVRSYDAKRLYHHPELAIAHGDDYGRASVIRVEDRPEVPIYVLKGARDRLSAYTLVYEDRFVEDPISFQLRNVVSLLVRPRQLMTLFFVRGSPGSSTHPPGESPAEQLLLAAVDSFLAQRPAP